MLLPTLTPILTPRPAAGILLFFRIWLSGEVAAYLAYSAMVVGNSLVAGLLPPPDDSAVTPPLSARHMVAMPKLTEEECQSPLGSTFGYLTPNSCTSVPSALN